MEKSKLQQPPGYFYMHNAFSNNIHSSATSLDMLRCDPIHQLYYKICICKDETVLFRMIPVREVLI